MTAVGQAVDVGRAEGNSRRRERAKTTFTITGVEVTVSWNDGSDGVYVAFGGNDNKQISVLLGAIHGFLQNDRVIMSEHDEGREKNKYMLYSKTTEYTGDAEQAQLQRVDGKTLFAAVKDACGYLQQVRGEQKKYTIMGMEVMVKPEIDSVKVTVNKGNKRERKTLIDTVKDRLTQDSLAAFSVKLEERKAATTTWKFTGVPARAQKKQGREIVTVSQLTRQIENALRMMQSQDKEKPRGWGHGHG